MNLRSFLPELPVGAREVRIILVGHVALTPLKLLDVHGEVCTPRTGDPCDLRPEDVAHFKKNGHVTERFEVTVDGKKLGAFPSREQIAAHQAEEARQRQIENMLPANVHSIGARAGGSPGGSAA